jgi:ElaB/YqjD/DUF883 family membrane-anchored ribosome-binding protein
MMSEASRELEKKTGGDVPTADETIAATADEVVETAGRHRQNFEAGIRRDPLRSVFIAAGIGFVSAILLRRL